MVAHRRELLRLRTFKVTDFGTNRKPAVHFPYQLASYFAPFLSHRTVLVKISLSAGEAGVRGLLLFFCKS